MSINWAKYAAVMEEKVDQLSKAEKYRYWVTNLIGAPYRWGEEGPLGTDCSGTISFALWMMGYDIRTTAQGLLEQIFIVPADSYDESKAQAVANEQDLKNLQRTRLHWAIGGVLAAIIIGLPGWLTALGVL
jgi:cell wall-associated NlpC family hydrolase